MKILYKDAGFQFKACCVSLGIVKKKLVDKKEEWVVQDPLTIVCFDLEVF